MDFVKQWTVTVCVTVLISVIFSLLTPKGTMKNFYKIIISIFIFLSFIYPLANAGGFDFDKFAGDFTVSTNSVDDSSVYEKMVENNVKKTLSENGIDGANIKCVISSKNNEISVKSVTVYVPDEYDKNTASQIIFDNLGIKATVVNIGE